jgi:hypothetical protein
MSDAKPVENKIEAVAKAADAAVALTSPAAAPITAAKASAWAMRQKRMMFIAAGAVVGVAGGMYTFKYFTADKGKATTQQDPPAIAQSKPEDPAKPAVPKPDPELHKPAPVPVLDLDLPPIKVPDTKDIKPVPAPVLDLDLPPIKVPDTKDTKSAPVLDLDIPPIKPPVPDTTDTKPPVVVIPPRTTDTKDTKPSLPDPDLFKAPEPLPTTVTDRKDRKDTVIRIGGTDPMPTKKNDDPPPIPKIDLDIPLPPMPMKMGDPMAPKIDLDLPPPKPMRTDDPPIVSPPKIGPSPMNVDPPVISPKTTKIPDIPTIEAPPIKSPMIGDPPPPPLIGSKPANKDNYDEDWHTKLDDSFVQISKEYFKTPDYAAALEAYNKERRKPGERIVRVPPPWVLEEQYPNLIRTKSDKPEPKGTTTPKIEPVVPTPGERPAPPPAAVAGNNEYRVKAEAGETIREIARKIYGDANAWQKLWKLNPDLDPTLPIPSGTALRLEK